MVIRQSKSINHIAILVCQCNSTIFTICALENLELDLIILKCRVTFFDLAELNVLSVA